MGSKVLHSGVTTSSGDSTRTVYLYYFMSLAFALSGTSALMFEVVWTRKLAAIMGSSTYAVSTMLAAFMTGLSIGGFLGGWLAAKTKNTARSFALCELGIGLAGAITIPLINAFTPLYMKSYYLFHESFDAFMIVQFSMVFSIMLVPTVLMGMTFPLIIKFVAGSADDIGKRAGFLYGINTLGAVIGSVTAGFFLIPHIGVRSTAMVAALLNIVNALVILFLLREKKRVIGAVVAVVFLVPVISFAYRPAIPFFSYYSANRFGSFEFMDAVYEGLKQFAWEDIVLYEHEGVESDVYLMRDPANEYMIMNNGKLEGGQSPGFELLAYLPYYTQYRAWHRPQVMNIGLGSGVTLSRLAEFPLEHADSVELSDGILEVNRRFLRPGLFSDPRIRHVLADGRNFLSIARKKYDIIVISPSWAVEFASAGLLTDEFFALVSQRLAPDGVVALWIDYFLTSTESMRSLLNTFHRNFAYSIGWEVDRSSMILVGGNAPLAHSPEEVARSVASHDPAMAGRYQVVLREDDFPNFSDAPVNTDDLPVIEFTNAERIITAHGSGPAAR